MIIQQVVEIVVWIHASSTTRERKFSVAIPPLTTRIFGTSKPASLSEKAGFMFGAQE
jgi:hypothetical protein